MKPLNAYGFSSEDTHRPEPGSNLPDWRGGHFFRRFLCASILKKQALS